MDIFNNNYLQWLMPYLITIVYNTLWQMTSKHPIYLQYDRETGEYKEKILDPRKFL